MEFTVFTLFPEMFQSVIRESIMRRALDSGAVSVSLVNFRDFAQDKHHTVDDYPFGGGAGMLLKPAPLFEAVEAMKASESDECNGEAGPESPRIVLLSPQGRPFTHKVAVELATYSRVFLICGHYEGFDERIRSHLVDDEISLGDFVLTGGEIAAMAVMDAVIRLVPGVLGNHGSAGDDSFAADLLEYPQYTRPADYRGWTVPPVLLSGNHQAVEAWRRRHALYRTWVRRPDLLRHATLSVHELQLIECFERGDFSMIDVPDTHRHK